MYGFSISTEKIRTFIGILYMTGYHTLPHLYSNWSNPVSLECEYIKQSLGRQRLKRLKQNIHVCDNDMLSNNDKLTNVSPLNKLVNKKFIQFGVFSMLRLTNIWLRTMDDTAARRFWKVSSSDLGTNNIVWHLQKGTVINLLHVHNFSLP